MSPRRTFDDCRLRVKRANFHVHKLIEAWEGFMDREPYEIGLEQKPHGQCRMVVNVNPAIAVPNTLTMELGEALYQLRAALDGAVYASAKELGTLTEANEGKLEFPICECKKTFEDKPVAKKIAALNDPCRVIIGNVQPYLRPKNRFKSYNHVIGILNDWARKDRHRKLHVVGAAAFDLRLKLKLSEGTGIRDFVPSKSLLLYHKYELAKFRVVSKSGTANIKMKPDVGVQIAVDEIPAPLEKW